MSIQKLPIYKSIQLAFFGIVTTFKKERNIKIHLFFTLLVILAGSVLKISQAKWLAIILIILMIFSAEIFNSAVEETANLLTDKLNLKYEETKLIRDISAGAVLVLVIGSLIIAAIIFL